ncbi:MAG: hypothetical protein KC422_00930 [Trueperaceae bacterium]|nr:hypothetical protein [Trueperaceae bacterium]
MREVKVLVLALVLGSLISCGGRVSVPAPIPSNPEEGSPAPLEGLENIERPLVSSYFRIVESKNDTEVVQQMLVQDFLYRPRQSGFSGYEGWDVLTTPWPWGTPSGDKWLYVRLNRDAKMVLAINKWSTPAAWLGGWQKGSSFANNEKGEKVEYQTFSKDVTKGEVVLPPIPDAQYVLLFAESDGSPSAEPALPEGQTERPQANQTCPDWLSNSWVAAGPDDRLYKSWHPQIDPIYWCYYRHEHGSDPSLVGYEPVFDYVAYYNNRQNERHEGFKGFALIDKGIGWYINVHATSGLIGRACVQFHTVVFFARDMATGEKLLELSYKGDFGAIVNGNNDAQVIQPQLENCPDQSAVAESTLARKKLRIFQNGKDPGNYERWDGGTSRYLGMSFPNWSTGMGIDIRDPMTGCNNASCTAASFTETAGEQRSIRFHELGFSYNNLLDKSDGKAGDGYFYTDPYGTVQDDDAKNTLRQYIKPGFEALLDGQFITQDAWRGLYVSGKHQPRLELEDALGEMN